MTARRLIVEIDCRNDEMALTSRPWPVTLSSMSIRSIAASTRPRLAMCMCMCPCRPRVAVLGG